MCRLILEMEIYKKKIKSLKLLFSHLYMNRCESKKLPFLKKGSHKNLEQFFFSPSLWYRTRVYESYCIRYRARYSLQVQFPGYSLHYCIHSKKNLEEDFLLILMDCQKLRKSIFSVQNFSISASYKSSLLS